MLKVVVPGKEWFNETTNEFITFKDTTLLLEHSLLSISKWEAKWKIPFLEEKTQLTDAQFLDYIRCMTINHIDDNMIYFNLSADNIGQIRKYMNESFTATTIYRKKKPGSSPPKDRVTSELVYYWMVSYNIPFECQKWHISRLLSLIDICSFKNEQPTKTPLKQLARERSALNAVRCAKHKTSG